MAGIFEELERDWNAAASWFQRDTHGTQAPAVMPVNLGTTTTTEDHMITLAELEGEVRTAAAKFDQLDKAALAKFDAVMANPATADLFGILHLVSGIDLGPILPAVKILLQPYVPPQAEQQAAA